MGNSRLDESLASLVGRYLESIELRHYAHGTLVLYRQRLDDFVEWCQARGVTRPTEVDRDLLERYRSALAARKKRRMTKRTRYDVMCGLRTFFKWLSRTGVLLYNPSDELLLRPVPKNIRLPIHHSDVEKILAVIDTSTALGLRDRAMLEVMYSSGLRASELVSLELYDFDLDRGLVHVRLGKGRQDRLVPLGDRAAQWFSRYLDHARPELARHDPAAFVSFTGQRLNRNHPTNCIRDYAQTAGLRKAAGSHILRHTTATEMLEHGADARVIQELLGHKRLSTTAGYLHVAIKELRTVHARTHPAERDRTKAATKPRKKRPA